jgi:integrase/recombinase XerD
MTTIFIERIIIERNDRIRLRFKFDPDLAKKIKKLPDVKWDKDRRCWHIPDMDHHSTYLRKSFNSKYRIYYHNDAKFQTTSNNNLIHYQEMPAEDRIYVKFAYKVEIIDLLKTLNGPYWHAGIKLWSINGGKRNLWIFINTMLAKGFKPLAGNVYCIKSGLMKPDAYKFNNQVLPQKLINFMVLKNYSQRTIRIYSDHIRQFLESWKDNDVKDLSAEDISSFVHTTLTETNYSRSYQNQMINAIKLYYRVMQNRNFDRLDLPRPKKEKKLPIIFSRDEIISIIRSTINLKHKTVITLIYATGIRLGEVVNILVRDIDFQRKLIHIRAGKGKKDRIVPLPEILVKQLRVYLDQYIPNEYLFGGWKNQQYSTRSVQKVLKQALVRAGIQKNASVHSLRHTFATHALEDGIDIRLIQEILGHSNIKTTEIYTHISNATILSITSPIDKLDL